MLDARAVSFAEMQPFIFLCHFTMVLSWAKDKVGAAKRDKLGRSHFFSITTARLQGHHLQWIVRGDAPSRKHFNYGLLASVQKGAGSAG